jgi:hypothetical protein
MRHQDIQEGKTYLFVATLDQKRKHLEGKPFTVTAKKKVWRAQTVGRRHKVMRIFNVDGVAVRPDELDELPEDHCPECFLGKFGVVETHNGREKYECDQCGHTETFP